MPKMWPHGRVSLGPVTSSTVCSVAASLGLMPLSIDFRFVFGNSFHRVAAEVGRAGPLVRFCWTQPSRQHPEDRAIPKDIALFPVGETVMIFKASFLPNYHIRIFSL